MKSKYPIKNLIAFNLWLTFYFFLLGFVTTLANFGLGGLQRAILSSIIGAIFLIFNAFTNLALLLFFENKVIKFKSNLKIRYYVSSYFFSIVIFFTVIFVYSFSRHSSIHLSILVYVFIICILINTLVIALQNYVIIQDAKVKSDLENFYLKAANADAANQLLRQQIHPHFLFNALNILKSLYRTNTKAGEEYLLHLSDFLRVAVSTNNIKIIPVKDELKLCEDYLQMQKIRFGNALLYTISISEEVLKTKFLPSFSIHPLLENAIKHNELTDESPLHIQIIQEGERIRVSNNLKLKATTEVSTGSGLMNLSERYKILAKDEIIISEGNGFFSVSIKILNHEDSNHRHCN